jgi:hypothetical protein
MVKDTKVAKKSNIADSRLDFDQYKLRFREATVNIANDFASATCDVWTWLKKRLDYVFKDGVVTSRQFNDTKQKSYITSGAAAIWNETSQAAIGIIRAYVPNILNKLPEAKCHKCGNPYRVYSAGLKAVENGWQQMQIIKNSEISKLRLDQHAAMVGLFRDARTKFKYTLSPACYDENGQVLPRFHKDVFMPELMTQIEQVFNFALNCYIETVINALPDMTRCKCLCAGCYAPVQLNGSLDQ